MPFIPALPAQKDVLSPCSQPGQPSRHNLVASGSKTADSLDSESSNVKGGQLEASNRPAKIGQELEVLDMEDLHRILQLLFVDSGSE